MSHDVQTTRSQAVARLADRTASQSQAVTAPLGSRDVIGHVTIWYPHVISYWWSFGSKPLSL